MVALVETTMEYGVGHLGRDMAATTVETSRTALRRKYRAKLSMAARRGYANLLFDRTKYVSTCKASPNIAQMRQDMRSRGDMGEHSYLFMAHETDAPLRDAFPSSWGDCWGML